MHSENNTARKVRFFSLTRLRIPARVGGIQLLTLVVVVLLVLLPPFLAPPTARGEGRLPGDTHIAGVNVSGLKPADALKMIDAEVQSAYENRFVILLNGETLEYTATDIGLVFDPTTTVHNVIANGEGGNYPLAANLNPAQFQVHLDDISSNLPEPAVDAQVRINGIAATVTPGHEGEHIDLLTYQQDILSSAGEENPQIEVTVSTGEPNISTAEAEQTAAEVETMLLEPLVLTSGDLRWEIPANEVAAGIVIAPNQAGELSIFWDIDALQPSLHSVADEIEGVEPTDAWVQDLGTHSWLVPEQGEMHVDRKALFEKVNSTLNAGERSVEVPVTFGDPVKTSEEVMEELGITELIATGDSVYTGSGTGRSHNVETAAYYIDRTLVAPGGTFSFNDSVGSLFTGEYMSAGSYIDGPTGESIAGGVCQVSTTVFRAALNAGFPIIERWPHSYRSTFYEMGGWSPGFDASIVQDSIVPEDSSDFQFTNPTDSWVMITAETDGDRLVVDIWGADTGYDVSYSEPSVWVEYAAPAEAIVMVDDQLPPGTLTHQEPLDGLGVSITRTVHDRNGELVLQDTFNTTYYATGPIIRVSPDMEDEAYALGG